MTELERKAYNDAYRQKYVNFVLLPCRRNFKPDCDRRTKFGKMVDKFYHLIEIQNADELRTKHKERVSNSWYFIPLFSQPLIKDWINNRHLIKKIWDDHLNFGLRNHWAKTDTDFRFIKILKKYEERRNRK
jgi:hypothetical protein